VSLTTIQVAGTLRDASGGPASGTVTFAPSALLTDTSDSATVPAHPVPCYLNSQGGFLSRPLVYTDDDTISPSGWTYTITIALAASPPQYLIVLLPAALGPVADLSELVQVTPQPAVTS
jgi:hypothetical protein